MAAPDEVSVSVLSTLANGLDILDALADGPLSLRQLAENLTLAYQTTYRLVRTLEEKGWVKRDENTYRLTPKLWSFGAASFTMTDLRDELSPIVRRLAAEYGETVHLAIYDAGSVVYIDKADGWQPIRSYTKLGGRSPAHAVATGKVLLSYLPERDRSVFLHTALQRFTRLTITDPTALSRELEEIRAQGYAVNHGERDVGVAGVAVPVRSRLGDTVAAIGFSGPAERILNNVDTLLSALNDAATDYCRGQDKMSES